MKKVIREGAMSDIDIIAGESKSFKDFVKEFYKEFKDFPKNREAMKWLEDTYKSVNESTDSDDLERVADGLPQTVEESVNENDSYSITDDKGRHFLLIVGEEPKDSKGKSEYKKDGFYISPQKGFKGLITAYFKDEKTLKRNIDNKYHNQLGESINEATSKYPNFDLDKNIRYQDTSISSGMWRYTGKEQGGKGVYRNLNNNQFLGFSSDDFKYFKKHLKKHFDIDESVNEAKVSYDFSENELKRVLKLLGRNASTEVKMIKAFEKAFGRKLTRDELFESVNELDINDPIMIKLRAAQMKRNKDAATKVEKEKKINPDYKALKNATKIKALKKKRAEVMRDMEQEAEPEGGKIADRYGKLLNRIDNDIIKLGGNPMSESVNEEAKRDYKAEYKKFQSSTESKKYRAELNKYNRDKGTYGNGDGKDASHKGGKIVGFEAESKNRGRAEKSRLKKESAGCGCGCGCGGSKLTESVEPQIITQLKDIVNNKQNKVLVDPKSGKKMRVDLFSASAITQVYDALKQQSNKDKFVGSGLMGMQSMAMKLLK
jgi:hypothetical protein